MGAPRAGIRGHDAVSAAVRDVLADADEPLARGT